MKKTIILASSNKGKIREIKEIFKDYEVLSLKEAEERLKKELIVVENQPTFKENALEKTRCLYNLVGDEYICIGDDSGISIDALDGFPGVHTARWMDADDHTKNIHLLKKMDGQANRTCHYTTVIAIVGNNLEKTFEYTLDGNLTTEVRGCNGFGFDEIFELNSGKTLAEITTEEKFSVSPRNKALEKLKEYIQDNNI